MIILRPAFLADAQAIVDLAQASFIEAFGYIYSPQDLDQFLTTRRSLDVYRDIIADPQYAVIVAEEQGEQPIKAPSDSADEGYEGACPNSANNADSAGSADRAGRADSAGSTDRLSETQPAAPCGSMLAYLVLGLNMGFAQRPAPQPSRPMTVDQLYCAPGASGRGIGAQMMEWSLAKAREINSDAIQLSVYSENFGAQRFYQRYGFSKVADIDYWVGNHRDDEFLYELSLI